MKKRSDKLLYELGLWDVLSSHGKPHIVGSYLTDLMSWNDLDIYMEEDSVENYFSAVADLVKRFCPDKFDGFTRWGKNLGFETYVDGERFNVDIWWKPESDIAAAINFAKDVNETIKLHPEYRESIINIKKELIAKKLYGFDKGPIHYHSDEIYRAVFEEGISSPEEFLNKHAK